jgi:hypothetical protein
LADITRIVGLIYHFDRGNPYAGGGQPFSIPSELVLE